MTGRMPPVGSLRDRVQLQKRDMAPEPEGGHALVYLGLTNAWARVRVLSGHMGDRSGARGAQISHTVVMRYRSDIGPGDRIVYRGRKLEIISAGDLNGRRAYLSCQCAETAVTG